MIIPPFLQKGDRIGLVAPARFIEKTEFELGIQYIKKYGFVPVFTENILSRYNQFAGDDSIRLADFQKFLDDQNIKAIFCLRGGYGSIRIVDQLKWENFLKFPKWIVGFSDITIFHSTLHCMGVASLHAPMIINLTQENFNKSDFLKIFSVLKGEKVKYSIPPHSFNHRGNASGILVGGNLSILYALRGTKYDIDTTDKILFIEDVDEYLYHIDRMMMNFYLGKKFDKLKGIIVGQMAGMKDNHVAFGKNSYEIIAEYFSSLNIPVAFGFPAGHENFNCPLILGSYINLEVSDKVTLKFLHNK